MVVIPYKKKKKCFSQETKWAQIHGDTSTNIRKELDPVISTVGYSQIIDKPTHFTNNSSSCIDLIFTSNPNPSIVVDSGIEKSLYISCHHDMERLTLESLFHHILGLFGITRMLTLALFSVLQKTLTDNMHLNVKRLMKSYKFLVKF